MWGFQLVCRNCKVVDENVFIFSFKGEEPHREFFDLLIEKGCKLCMSDTIRIKYWEKLNRPSYYSDDYIDHNMLRRMKIYISDERNFNHCPPEECSEDVEDWERFSNVPRKDRFLVTVSEHFNTFIVTDDDELYDSVNSDEDLISSCKRSNEAIRLIMEK
jgi:hypothetical protein